MSMAEHTFVDVPDFLRRIQNYPSICWIYRGQADHSWPLVPKAGRDEYFDPQWDAIRAQEPDSPPKDIGRFNAWIEQAVAYTKHLPDDPFECLAYAQHYGLATRLLDWTANPLVALYFAAETNHEVSGAVYCYLCWSIVDRNTATIDREFRGIPMYKPRPFDQRVIAQQAIFTVHHQPQIPMTAGAPPPETVDMAPDNVDLVRFSVSADAKPIILRQLSDIGIDRRRLFPDLDGLSDFINWETRRLIKQLKRQGQNGPSTAP